MRPTIPTFAALALSLASSLALPAYAMEAQPAHEEHEDHSHHVAELEGVRVLHAWTRATDANSAMVFAEIENAGTTPVTLLGGETDIGTRVTLVGFLFQNGEPAHVAIPEMPVAAGGRTALAPNGLALQIDGLDRRLAEGEHFEMELDFDIGHVSVTVEIESADATRHSHAGHQH